MQSLWQKAPHCLHTIMALTLQATGFEAEAASPAAGGFGRRGTTPCDFSIILLPGFDGGIGGG
jgi:hypothetical protein